MLYIPSGQGTKFSVVVGCPFTKFAQGINTDAVIALYNCGIHIIMIPFKGKLLKGKLSICLYFMCLFNPRVNRQLFD